MPATANTTGWKAYAISTAISAYLRVNINSSGSAVVANNTVRGSGIAWADNNGDGSIPDVTVRLNTAPGTAIGVLTAAPSTVGDTLYAAAGGMIAPTGTVIVGLNMNILTIGQTSNGSLVEYIVQGEV